MNTKKCHYFFPDTSMLFEGDQQDSDYPIILELKLKETDRTRKFYYLHYAKILLSLDQYKSYYEIKQDPKIFLHPLPFENYYRNLAYVKNIIIENEQYAKQQGF